MKKTNRLIDYFAMNIQQQEKNKNQRESWEAIAKKVYELIKEKTTILLDGYLPKY